MLMVSIIFDEQTTPEIEQIVHKLCLEFSEKLLKTEEIFAAFYISDINNFEDEDKEVIYKYNALVKLWVQELYWNVLEDTREKSEEEKIATLLNKKHMFMTLKKLSKGPTTLEGFDLDDCLFDSTMLSQRARIEGIDAMINFGLKIDRQKALILIDEIVKEYGSNSPKHYNYFIRRLNELEKFSISFIDQVRYIAAAVMAYHAQKIKLIKIYD
ncbi:unnamed protein product, partial [marine sediment metagenome]